MAKKAGQRLSIKRSARKSIPTKMPITFQLIFQNASETDIMPEIMIRREAIQATMLLREGKTKNKRYATQNKIRAIYFCSNISLNYMCSIIMRVIRLE